MLPIAVVSILQSALYAEVRSTQREGKETKHQPARPEGTALEGKRGDKPDTKSNKQKGNQQEQRTHKVTRPDGTKLPEPNGDRVSQLRTTRR